MGEREVQRVLRELKQEADRENSRRRLLWLVIVGGTVAVGVMVACLIVFRGIDTKLLREELSEQVKFFTVIAVMAVDLIFCLVLLWKAKPLLKQGA